MGDELAQYLWPAAAAVGAGFVNAIAGGGTLLTFPVLLAVGIPPVAANITNSVALCPGFVGGVLAQAHDLHGQRQRLLWLVPAGLLGGGLGSLLLLNSGERLFTSLVPFLILFATLLLAVQVPLRRLVTRHMQLKSHPARAGHALLPVMLGAIYGGYFGAGLGMVLLAALGLTLEDTLARINALKQVMSLVINGAAMACFVASGEVRWPIAGAMAGAALLGGALGGRLASRIEQEYLRRLMVLLGGVLSAYYFLH